MAFDIYAYTVPAAGLRSGDVVTLGYSAGRSVAKYRAAGAHFALAPNASLVTAPGKFTVSFNAPSIAVTWAGSFVPAGSVLKFQFETVDGPKGADGKEIAHATGDNIDLASLGLVPTVSPAFTGVPTAPTAAPGTNTTQIATTAFAAAAIAVAVAALVNASPAALDTLKELADALGDDANFATTITNALGLKAPLANPVFTGALNASGSVVWSGVVTPAAIAATQNDYAPAGLSTAAVARLSATGAQSITGIAGGAGGRLLVLQNVGAATIALLNANAGSLAANRFAFSFDRTLEPGRSLFLIYDATLSAWVDAVPLTKALGSGLRLGTGDERFLTPKAIFDAAIPVAVAFSATQTLDLSTGFNFDLGAATANFTLANPTSAKIGQSGRIRIPQDGTGSRLISYGTWWKSPGGAQALSTAASAVDCIYYFVRDATTIEYTLAKAFG